MVFIAMVVIKGVNIYKEEKKKSPGAFIKKEESPGAQHC